MTWTNEHRLIESLSAAIRAPRLRTIREFAEQEVVIPSGPFEGLKFRVHRQPWAGLWFDAIDSHQYRRHFNTGGQQAGKTLVASTIPLLWHLFEYREDVIYGVPDMDMVADKWHDDILPVIQASRFRDTLPKSGRGSKGGTPKRIQFNHGPSLRFMTGGGGDKARAGKTARPLIVTEVDGFDSVGAASREADKFSQLEGRIRAFGAQGRLYAECTVSTDSGRTWREIQAGSNSRIACPCPACHAFVTPEREHLVGWRDAVDEQAAREQSGIVCPACGVMWSEDDRRAANLAAVLIHAGQEIDSAGQITGTPKRTDTLGFRWTAANNMLMSQADVALEEYRTSRDPDEERGEKKMRQFFWALPHEANVTSLTSLAASSIVQRQRRGSRRGTVPEGTEAITLGIDLGERLCHWTAIAWLPNATPHVFEYDRLTPASDLMAPEQALLLALREFRDSIVNQGWPLADGTIATPGCVLIDSGTWTQTVYTFCIESGPPFFPGKGFGARQAARQSAFAGRPWRESPLDNGLTLIDVNADEAKSYVHARLQTPPANTGAMTLFETTSNADHLTFANHLLAERRVEEYVAGKGTVTKWEAIRRANHYLDSTALACVGGMIAGQQVVTVQPSFTPPPPKRKPRPDYMPSRPERYLPR